MRVPVAQKCPTGQNAISRQPTKIFLPKFQDLQRKEFPTTRENFIEIFSLLQESQLCNILFRISKLRRRNGQSLVTFNVQVVKQFISKQALNIYHSFHISSMSFCKALRGPVFLSPAAVGPILSAKIFFSPSVFFIVFKHSSPDVIDQEDQRSASLVDIPLCQ